MPRHDLPTGIVFSCFMICITIGGILFKWMAGVTTVEKGSVGVFLVAALSMLVPLYSSNYMSMLLAFMLLEVCVGMFFACAATMRSEYIPDALQSSVMNVFRVPLNLIVVIGTKLSDVASPRVVFLTCAVWFAMASLCQCLLVRRIQRPEHGASKDK